MTVKVWKTHLIAHSRQASNILECILKQLKITEIVISFLSSPILSMIRKYEEQIGSLLSYNKHNIYDLLNHST